MRQVLRREGILTVGIALLLISLAGMFVFEQINDLTVSGAAPTGTTTAQSESACGDGHVTTHLHPESGEVHIDLHGYGTRAIINSPTGPGFAFCAARAVHDALLAPSIHAALADVQPQTGPTVTVEGRRVVLSGFERIDKSDGVLILDQSYANARALTDGLTAAFARIDGHAHPHDHDSFHLPDDHSLPDEHGHEHVHDDAVPHDHDHAK